MDTQIAPLQFSQDPGCRERHLIRKYRNPLFYALKNTVTQPMIDLAQLDDIKEQENFETEFRKLMLEIDTMQRTQKVGLDEFLSLRDKVDYRYDQCSALGGDRAAYKKMLADAYEWLSYCAKKAQQGGQCSSAVIEQDSSVRRLHLDLVEYQLVCDLLRPDSPIEDCELVATLLSEDVESVQIVMSLFEAEQQQIIRQEAQYLVDRLKLNQDKSSNATLVLRAMLQSKQ